MRAARTAGLVAGYVADQVFPVPRPVSAGLGATMAADLVEERLYADSRARGVAYAATLVGGAAALGWVAERRTPSPLARFVLTTVATWAVLGGRSADRDAQAVRGLIDGGHLPAARRRLSRMEPMAHRDTLTLSPAEISRATIESLASTTSDAVVTPLIWGAVAGVPGMVAARAAGAAAAGIGRHHGRSDAFGWAAARLDDLITLPGSRLTGALAVVSTPHRALPILAAMKADSWKHPRPNAGVPEAAFAGALAVQLGGVSRYDGDRIQRRAVLGSGSVASAEKITTALWLARRIGFATAAGIVLVPLGWSARRRRRRSAA